ncbi:hypothetical protein [Actinomadura rupiterrae]|uniref:hypothetical protein n=1 Tax=Actinomadura rupiterrae TaxID=559627 RepID=UPI0020A44BCD|nr:hypothetical protein [Actinomadura rupiterrae]MCP2337516.1 hypothetical protein [Actinomadura rupiterrae]
MALYTLMSPSESPGVTTTALALTYTWNGRALLAECDPKGGDVLAGFLRGRMAADAGLLNWALSIAHDPDPARLWNNVISLDGSAREWLLLPGLRDPREAAQLEGAWAHVAGAFEVASSAGVDVMADIGRIGGPETPMGLVAASDMAIMLLHPSLRQVTAAKPRLDALGRHVGSDVPVALCLVGQGEYPARAVSEALFGLPVIAEIPHDPRSAELLSDGRGPGRAARRTPLMNGVAALATAMRAHAEAMSGRGDQDVAAVAGGSW